MSRPRVAAIVSAIVASTSAFLVVSRWSLFGTVAGVVLFTVVNTFVSHWSSEGLDRATRVLRKRTRLGRRITRTTAASAEAADVQSPAGPAPRRGAVTNWLLVGCAVAAMALSVYSLAWADPGKTVETVVVRQQVIEKTVTVTTDGALTVARTSASQDVAGDAQAVDAVGADLPGSDAQSAESTTTTEAAPDATASTTTSIAAPDQPAGEGPSASTTTTDPGTGGMIDQGTESPVL